MGAVAVGYYSPAYSLGSAIFILSGPLAVVLPSALSKLYDEKNVEDVREIMERSIKYYFWIAIPCAVACQFCRGLC